MKSVKGKSTSPTVQVLEPRLLLASATAAALITTQSAPPPLDLWDPAQLVDGQLVFHNSGDDHTSEEIFNLTSGQWSTFSLGRSVGDASAVVGDTLLFAGGTADGASTESPTSYGSTQVDLYNAATGQWSTAQLSSPRIGMTAVTDGNKVFFAGGESDSGGYAGSAPPESTVDIYDSATNEWSTAALSQARYGPAAVAVDGQAIFAGGSVPDGSPTVEYGSTASDVVDIYNTATGQWSTAQLPEAMADISTAVVGNKAFFFHSATEPGGSANGELVDIYDASSATWSQTNVPGLLGPLTVNVVDNNLLCVGGSNSEIYDPSTGHWSSSAMPLAISNGFGATVGDDVLFTGFANTPEIGYSAELYNAATNQWSIVGLPLGYKIYNDFNYDVPGVNASGGELYISAPAGPDLLPILEYQPTSSQVPSNQFPLSGATSEIAPKVFHWSPTAGATSYRVYYDKALVATVTDNRWVPDSSIKLTGGHIWYVAANVPGGVIAGLPTAFTLLDPVVDADLTSWSFPDATTAGAKGHAQVALTIDNIRDLPKSIIVGVSLYAAYSYQNGNALLGSKKITLDPAAEGKTINVSVPITAPSGLYSTLRYFPAVTVRIGRKVVVDYPSSGPLYLVIKPKRPSIFSLPMPWLD